MVHISLNILNKLTMHFFCHEDLTVTDPPGGQFTWISVDMPYSEVFVHVIPLALTIDADATDAGGLSGDPFVQLVNVDERHFGKQGVITSRFRAVCGIYKKIIQKYTEENTIQA